VAHSEPSLTRTQGALVIRSAAASDLDEVTPLAGSRDRARVRLQAAEHGEESMLVAVVAGNVVGVESVRWRNGCDPPHPWVYGLAVVTQARRRGIGRALVEAAEGMSVARGAGHVSLDVDADDAGAMSFYESLGYRVVRSHEHHWRSIDPDTGGVTAEGIAPTWIMRRTLHPGGE